MEISGSSEKQALSIIPLHTPTHPPTTHLPRSLLPKKAYYSKVPRKSKIFPLLTFPSSDAGSQGGRFPGLPPRSTRSGSCFPQTSHFSYGEDGRGRSPLERQPWQAVVETHFASPVALLGRRARPLSSATATHIAVLGCSAGAATGAEPVLLWTPLARRGCGAGLR